MDIENSHVTAIRVGLRHVAWPPRPAAAPRTTRRTGAVAGAYRAVDSSARRGRVLPA